MDNGSEKASEQVKKKIPNPTGKGGFQDHPEIRNNGGRYPRGESFTYWMSYFKNLSVKEFMDYEKNKPDSERTVAESLAYARVSKARNELKEFQEVANRTEGMPTQKIEQVTFNDPEMADWADEVRQEIERNRELRKTNSGA